MKDFDTVRNRQVNLYFSASEKKALDGLCDYYDECSRTDFVRIAMYIAFNDPVIYTEALMRAREEGYLTGAPSRRRK